MSFPASATNLLFTTFAPAQTFTTTGNAIIFKSGSFFQAFSTSQQETVMISFSAVCTTSGTGNQFTSIQILIDGKAVYPTDHANNALCSSEGAGTATDKLATSSITTAVSVSSGNHNVQVTVTPHNGGTSRIQFLTLLAWD